MDLCFLLSYRLISFHFSFLLSYRPSTNQPIIMTIFHLPIYHLSIHNSAISFWNQCVKLKFAIIDIVIFIFPTCSILIHQPTVEYPLSSIELPTFAIPSVFISVFLFPSPLPLPSPIPPPSQLSPPIRIQSTCVHSQYALHYQSVLQSEFDCVSSSCTSLSVSLLQTQSSLELWILARTSGLSLEFDVEDWGVLAFGLESGVFILL